MKLRFFILFLLTAFSASADKYFTVAGGGSGTSWSDPATFSVAALAARGTTNWIADGSYSGFTFNQAQSGSTYAIIKKATVASHGTATGWADSMGDGQAAFSGWITIVEPYLMLDGSERTESATWTAPTGYGFKAGRIYSNSNDGDDMDYSIIRYVDIGYTYTTTFDSAMYEAVYMPRDHVGVQFIRCAIHCARYTAVQAAGADDLVFDHCDIGPSWGKEAIRGGNGSANLSSGWTISNNRFWNSTQFNASDEGAGITAEIGIWDWTGTSSGFKIYGNWFFNEYSSVRNAIIVVGGDGSSWAGGAADGTVVYNNTFAGIADDSSFSAVILNGASTVARNNLFYDCPGGANSTNIDADTKSDNWVASSDPFVNYAARNYNLSGALAGYSLASPYNIDPNGETRGADGTFDVGAYEFSGTTFPPVITSSLTAVATNGLAFSYSITTSNTATTFGATPLPLGISHSAGVLSGTPTGVVSYSTNTILSVTNSAGDNGAGDTLVITVYNGLPPTFTTSPAAATNSESTGVVLTSAATTTYGSLTYQWQSNSVNISGATSANYSKVPAVEAVDSGLYRVIASNSWGSMTSSAVYVSITNATLPPVITASNISGTINVALSYQISATEGPTAFGATGLQTGLSLDAGTGLITGSPTEASTNAVTISATNSYGYDQEVVTFSVASVVDTNISVGSRVQVNISPTLRVRDAADLSGNILGEQNYEAQGTVTDGPITADGYVWWEINYDTAPDGWSIEGSGSAYWLIVTPGGDTNAPSVAITGPSDSGSYSTNSPYLTLSGTASDDVGLSAVTVNLDGYWLEPQTATGTTTWTVDVQIPSASGTYTFDAVATDTSSNTATNSITINLALPFRVSVGTVRATNLRVQQ